MSLLVLPHKIAVYFGIQPSKNSVDVMMMKCYLIATVVLLLLPSSSWGCLTASQIESIKKECSPTVLETPSENKFPTTTTFHDDGPLCVIMVEEPTFIEFDRSRFQGDMSNHFDIFQCNDHSNDIHCLDGAAFDILRRNKKDFDKMTCIFASECGFNEIAHLVATADAVRKHGNNKGDSNIDGIGDRVKLIFAGFLLQSHFRIDLGNIFSSPYVFEHLALVGVVEDGVKNLETPADLLKGAASPSVFALAAAFLACFAGIVFYYGGNEEYHHSLDEEVDIEVNPMISIQGQAAATQKSVLKQTRDRFFSIHYPDLKPLHPVPQRLQRLVQLQFLFVACCGGALFLFESVLIFSPKPMLPQINLEKFVRDRKVFLVQDTALQENIYSLFPDLKNYFQNCSNFRECTEEVIPNHPGSYLLTPESIAFSRGLEQNGANVAAYPTDMNLGTLPGFFIYSSALSAEDRANMDKALLDVSFEPDFVENRIAAHTTREQEPSRQYLFTKEMFLWGLAIPFLALLEVEIVVFLLCFVWAISRKCQSETQQTPDYSRLEWPAGAQSRTVAPTGIVLGQKKAMFRRFSTSETMADDSEGSFNSRSRTLVANDPLEQLSRDDTEEDSFIDRRMFGEQGTIAELSTKSGLRCSKGLQIDYPAPVQPDYSKINLQPEIVLPTAPTADGTVPKKSELCGSNTVLPPSMLGDNSLNSSSRKMPAANDWLATLIPVESFGDEFVSEGLTARRTGQSSRITTTSKTYPSR